MTKQRSEEEERAAAEAIDRARRRVLFTVAKDAANKALYEKTTAHRF